MYSRLYQGDHPDLAQSLNNLGVSYERLGENKEALEYKLKAFNNIFYCQHTN